MKKVLVIGLNDEGRRCVIGCNEKNYLAAAIDHDSDRIMALADYLCLGVCSEDYDLSLVDADCFDICLICLDNDQVSLIGKIKELKKMKAARIVVVKDDKTDEKNLIDSGADELIAFKDFDSWLNNNL